MSRLFPKFKFGVPSRRNEALQPFRWRNPFIVGKDGSHLEVMKKYQKWLLSQPPFKLFTRLKKK